MAAANSNGIFHFERELRTLFETPFENLSPKLNLGKLQADISTTSDGKTRPTYLNPVSNE